MTDFKEGSSNIGNSNNLLHKKNLSLPYWMKNAIVIDSKLEDFSSNFNSFGLSNLILRNLQENNINYFFPVQRHVIPMLLNSQLTTSIHPGDLCVCAPTGSGKTLAYVLPILHHLLQKRMRKLRCLIILPTRDLVQQVYKVVEKYAKGTSLKFTSCTGQTSFEAEQKLLVSFNKVTGAYESLVDIVVATPGRLLDHLGSTRGFTLQYLRFLVLDEADRLFYESYYDWLSKTLKSIYSADEPFREEPVVLTPAFIQIPTLPLQKLVFSATLTPNPQKLSALRLQFPKFITAATYEKFVTPEKLKEYKIVCSTLEKPLVLVYLLQKLNFKNVLCFTSSVESTHRLFLLLKLFGGISVAEYSSLLPQKTKEHVLEAFKCNQIDVLVCSDSMARGMDLENVEKVICFDAPFHMKTYIHRVGRTARAGRAGEAYTIIKREEVKNFEKMFSRANKHNVELFTINSKDLRVYESRVSEALVQLKSTLKDEKSSASDFSGLIKIVKKRLKQKISSKE